MKKINHVCDKSTYCPYCIPFKPEIEPKIGVFPVKSKCSESRIKTTTQMILKYPEARLKLVQVDDELGYPNPVTPECECVPYNKCKKCGPPKDDGKSKICKCDANTKLDKGAYELKTIMSAARRLERLRRRYKPDMELWHEKQERRLNKIKEKKIKMYNILMRHIEEQRRIEEKNRMRRLKFDTSATWLMQLSSQQLSFVESLSLAIRLDLEEGVSDRTYYVLSRIGLHPRPRSLHVKKSLRCCNFNAILFLHSLFLFESTVDKYQERDSSSYIAFNDMLLMNAMCHLGMPRILQEIVDRMPKLPQQVIGPQVKLPKLKVNKIQYKNPYYARMWPSYLRDWVVVRQVEATNRYRKFLATKRVPLPELALVKNDLLVDARPPYLDRIKKVLDESGPKQERRPIKKKKRIQRKREVITFDSDKDVTAVEMIKPEDDDEDNCLGSCVLKWPEIPLETVFMSHAEDMLEQDENSENLEGYAELECQFDFGETQYQLMNAEEFESESLDEKIMNVYNYGNEEFEFGDYLESGGDLRCSKIIDEEICQFACSDSDMNDFRTQQTLPAENPPIDSSPPKGNDLADTDDKTKAACKINKKRKKLKKKKQEEKKPGKEEKKKKVKKTKRRKKRSVSTLRIEDEVKEVVDPKLKDKSTSVDRNTIIPEQIPEKEISKVYHGPVEEVLSRILRDLADEGHVVASFPDLTRHPAILQLQSHLKGEIMTRFEQEALLKKSTKIWVKMLQKPQTLRMNASIHEKEIKTYKAAERLKIEADYLEKEYFLKCFRQGAILNQKFWSSFYPEHTMTDKFFNTYYSYLPSKYEDVVWRC